MKCFSEKHQALIFISLILLGFCSCQPENKLAQSVPVAPFAKIKDQKIKNILQKSFDRLGGLDRWKSKRAIHFKKYFALYDETGATEMAVDQVHDYFYAPKEQINIRWNKEGAEHWIKSEEGQLMKNIDGQLDTSASPTNLTNTVMSATFVMDIPFKLLDEGVELHYTGVDTLDGGQVVEVIQAIYDPEVHEQHTTPDIWWYYFDQQDFRLCGYMVKHLDHYSYVRNLSYIETNGFLLTKERKSYRVDSLRNLLYLRADYAYSNYKVELD